MSGQRINFDRPHVVYRAFDAHGTLLYVGMTCNLKRRVDDHRRRGLWFHQAAAWTVDGYPDRWLAWAAEQHAINTEGAVHNVTYSEIGRRGWQNHPVRPLAWRHKQALAHPHSSSLAVSPASLAPAGLVEAGESGGVGPVDDSIASGRGVATVASSATRRPTLPPTTREAPVVSDASPTTAR